MTDTGNKIVVSSEGSVVGALAIKSVENKTTPAPPTAGAAAAAPDDPADVIGLDIIKFVKETKVLAQKGNLFCYACGVEKKQEEFKAVCMCLQRGGICFECKDKKTGDWKAAPKDLQHHSFDIRHNGTEEYKKYCAAAYSKDYCMFSLDDNRNLVATKFVGPEGQTGVDFEEWAFGKEYEERAKYKVVDIHKPFDGKRCTCCDN